MPVPNKRNSIGSPPMAVVGVLHLRTLDESKHHESLDLGVRGVDGLDDPFLTALERGQCIPVVLP